MTKTNKQAVDVDKMQQHLQNLDSMLDTKIFNLMLEFCDMRQEIRQLRMDLHEISEMQNRTLKRGNLYKP